MAEKAYVIEPTSHKQAVVKDMNEKLSRAVGAIMLDYRGLTVSEVSDLRTKLGEADAEFHVIKNTLLRIASDGTPHDFSGMLGGPTAVALLYSDPVGPAKVFSEYLETHRNVAIKGGVLNGRSFSPAQIATLAKTPPRDVLIAQFVGSLASPLAGFVGTLSGVLSSFVFTLQAVADQKGADASA